MTQAFNQTAPFRLAVTCFRGLADLLVDELRELGHTGATALNPELVAISPRDLPCAPEREAAFIEELASRLRLGRRILRVFTQQNGKMLDLEQIANAAMDLPYETVLDGALSFGVKPERLGCHPFTSEDLGREIGACVRRRFRAQGANVPSVDLKTPAQVVIACAHDTDFYAGVDLCGRLDARGERSYQHRAALNPTLAAAMLRLSSFRVRGTVCDPMAGGGGVAIEAFRTPTDNGGLPSVIAAEKFQQPFNGLVRNVEAAVASHAITTYRADAKQLTYMKPGSCPLIVTNPPYAVRIGDESEVDDLYQGFAVAAAQKGVQEIVAITTRKHCWSDSLTAAGFALAHQRPVLYGRLATWIMVHVRKQGTFPGALN